MTQIYLIMSFPIINVLGTNGWYSSKTGNTLSILIRSENYTLIFDAGDGIHKIADILSDIKTPVHLFLSHLHLDHISGLHTLAHLSFPKGLTIYGPPGTAEILGKFITYPFTVPISELKYQVQIFDLPEGRSELPYQVTASYLVHTQPVYGYRIELERTITFCTDTGPCDNFLRLAHETDLLISECSYLPGQITPEWPHMNPEMVIELASRAKVKKLLLVHFAADLYTTLQLRREIQKPDTGFEIIIGEDDMVIEVT